MNRRERRARGQRGGLHKKPEWYLTRCAWASDDSVLEEAKRVLHDELIATLGAARRGPVYWKIVQGEHVDEALTAIDRGSDRHDDELHDVIQQGRDEYPDGYLVVGLLGSDRRLG